MGLRMTGLREKHSGFVRFRRCLETLEGFLKSHQRCLMVT